MCIMTNLNRSIFSVKRGLVTRVEGGTGRAVITWCVRPCTILDPAPSTPDTTTVPASSSTENYHNNVYHLVI